MNCCSSASLLDTAEAEGVYLSLKHDGKLEVISLHAVLWEGFSAIQQESFAWVNEFHSDSV